MVIRPKPRLEARDPGQDRPLCGRASAASSPSSGSSTIVWPFLTLRPDTVGVADGLGDLHRLDAPAGSVIGRGVRRTVDASGRARGGPRRPRRRCGSGRRDRPIGHRGDLPGRQDDVRVVGQDEQLVRLDRLHGLQQLAGRRVRAWPPRTTRNAPCSRNSVAVSISTSARPSEGATATIPSGNGVAGVSSVSPTRSPIRPCAPPPSGSTRSPGRRRHRCRPVRSPPAAADRRDRPRDGPHRRPAADERRRPAPRARRGPGCRGSRS